MEIIESRKEIVRKWCKERSLQVNNNDFTNIINISLICFVKNDNSEKYLLVSSPIKTEG